MKVSVNRLKNKTKLCHGDIFLIAEFAWNANYILTGFRAHVQWEPRRASTYPVTFPDKDASCFSTGQLWITVLLWHRPVTFPSVSPLEPLSLPPAVPPSPRGRRCDLLPNCSRPCHRHSGIFCLHWNRLEQEPRAKERERVGGNRGPGKKKPGRVTEEKCAVGSPGCVRFAEAGKWSPSWHVRARDVWEVSHLLACGVKSGFIRE